MDLTGNPKYDWLLAQVASGYTTVLGKEDDVLWNTGKFGVNVNQDLSMIKSVIIGEQLEQVDNPVEYLKETKTKYPNAEINITVPNEWGWHEQFKPFKNPKHLRHYDADSLINDLTEAGLTYKIELLDFKGWSFFVCRCKGVSS